MTRFKTWLGEGRHKIIFICCVCCLALFCLFVAVFAVRSRTPSREELISELERDVYFSECVRFERRVDGEYENLFVWDRNLVIDLSSLFPDLLSCSEIEERNEQWSYKLSYNCKDLIPTADENVVEVCDTMLRVNGVCYELEGSDGIETLLERCEGRFNLVKSILGTP